VPFFIDRNGLYFEPILEYLRTGELDIASEINENKILREAEFYCIEGIVTILKEKQQQQQQQQQQTIESITQLRFDGCYILEDNSEHKKQSAEIGLCFNPNGNCIQAHGDPYNSLMIANNVKIIPQLWKVDIAENLYANFMTKNIRRGKYWVENNYIRVLVTQFASNIGIVKEDHLLLSSTNVNDPKFERYNFKIWS